MAAVSNLQLESLFIQKGLKGIISDYIKNPTDEVKAYITRKIRSSLALFILWFNDTDMPFIDVSTASNGWFVYIFSDENVANGFMKRKQEEGYNVSLQEVVGGKRRMEFFSYLADSGTNVLLIDLALYQSIKEYVNVPNYNGYTETKPLRNSTLNAVMLYYLEKIEVGQVTEKLEHRFAQQLVKSFYYIPTLLDVTMIREDEATPLDYPIYKTDEGLMFMPAFTDFHQFEAQVNANRYTATIFDFYSLQKLVRDYKLEYMVLNFGTAHIPFTYRDFTKFINIAAQSVTPMAKARGL